MLYSIFFSRPPKAKLALWYREASPPFEEYKLCTRMQEKNAGKRKIFSGSRPYFPTTAAVEQTCLAVAGGAAEG
jgi:hypothetical protein